jgi:hypothetical protein
MAMPVVQSVKQGPQKKKNTSSVDGDKSRNAGTTSIFCNVLLPALGIFALGVGVVCWMNCPELSGRVVDNGAASSSNNSVSSINGGNIRASYINSLQQESGSHEKTMHAPGPYYHHKHHDELNEPERDHDHHHHHHVHAHAHHSSSLPEEHVQPHAHNQHNQHHSQEAHVHVHHHEPEQPHGPENRDHHHADHYHPRSPSNGHHHHHHHYLDAHEAMQDETATTASLLDLSDDFTTAHQPTPLLEEDEKSRAVHVERIHTP